MKMPVPNLWRTSHLLSEQLNGNIHFIPYKRIKMDDYSLTEIKVSPMPHGSLIRIVDYVIHHEEDKTPGGLNHWTWNEPIAVNYVRSEDHYVSQDTETGKINLITDTAENAVSDFIGDGITFDKLDPFAAGFVEDPRRKQKPVQPKVEEPKQEEPVKNKPVVEPNQGKPGIEQKPEVINTPSVNETVESEAEEPKEENTPDTLDDIPEEDPDDTDTLSVLDDTDDDVDMEDDVSEEDTVKFHPTDTQKDLFQRLMAMTPEQIDDDTDVDDIPDDLSLDETEEEEDTEELKDVTKEIPDELTAAEYAAQLRKEMIVEQKKSNTDTVTVRPKSFPAIRDPYSEDMETIVRDENVQVNKHRIGENRKTTKTVNQQKSNDVVNKPWKRKENPQQSKKKKRHINKDMTTPIYKPESMDMDILRKLMEG